MSASLRYETLPDGRRVEVVRVPGPRVSRKRIAKGSDLHPELRDEFEITETYDAAEVEEWADALGREHERGLVDGAVSGDFPRRSALQSEMVAAGLDAAALAQAAALPVALIASLAESGELPADAHRAQIESVLPDAFPQFAEALEPSPNERSGNAPPSASTRPTRTEGPNPVAATRAADQRSRDLRGRVRAERADAQAAQTAVELRAAERRLTFAKVRRGLDRISERL